MEAPGLTKAADFEYRHQTLIHPVIVTIAFLTYLIDRVDIVWSFVLGRPHAQLLERMLFSLAAAFIGISASNRTWALANRENSSLGHGAACGAIGSIALSAIRRKSEIFSSL
jgi:hypothetical protein